MKILYTALRYDYGCPEQGPSFEHQTFYDTLSQLEHEIIYFELDTLMKEHGRAWMNRRLWEIAEAEDPDLLFCVLFGDELDKTVMRRISEELRTVTVNWFCDDHWRFHDFSRLWTPCFNWVVTTAGADVAPYEEHGLHNVIRSQWGCNHFAFRRLEDRELRHDVTFVGMAHGDRYQLISSLRAAGIDARAWGSGWPAGRLSVEAMVRVFNESRINLNLSHSSVSSRQASNTYVKQLKGRTFEVPGCGGFLLTQAAPELEAYFELGVEAAMFSHPAELVAKIWYYLDHEQERAAAADAGYARVRRDHTYERRFQEIFSRISGSVGDFSSAYDSDLHDQGGQRPHKVQPATEAQPSAAASWPPQAATGHRK